MLDTLSMAERLSGEYRTVFEKADMYSSMDVAKIENRDEKIMDLYDVLMEAENEGKPVEKIIGEDVETFCREFFGGEKKAKLSDIPKRIYDILKWVFLCAMLDVLLLDDAGSVAMGQINILPFICGIISGGIISIIYKYWLTPMIFKNKRLKPLTHSVLILGVFIVCVVASIILLQDMELGVNHLSIVVITGAYCVIYLVARSVWRYKKYGRIVGIDREEKRMQKEFNREVFLKSLEQPVAQSLEKRFIRMNKRKKKHGKREITQQEFATKVRREGVVGWRLLRGFMVVVVVTPAVFEMLHNSLLEGLILGTVLAVVEGLIYVFFYKAMKPGEYARLYILKECERLGMGIVEYARGLREE